jgi:biotin/methionine sulfoxide reductase
MSPMAASSPRARSPGIPIPRVSPTSSPPPSITRPASCVPSIRRGWLDKTQGSRRGSDDFVELPWDEALDIAAHEIDRVRRDHGNEAIFGGSYGWASAGRFHHAQSQAHRFLNCIGGYVASFGSYSTGCAQSIMPHVFGVDFLTMLYEHQDGWPTIHDHTETLVMFGGINAKNAQVSMGGITEHETRGWFDRFAEKGMRCVNIGPQRSDAPESCDWMPVRPGLRHRADARAGLRSGRRGAREPRLPRQPYGGLREVPPLPDGRDRRQPEVPGLGRGRSAASARTYPRPCAPHGHDPHAHHRRLVPAKGAEHGEQPYWMSAVLAAMLGQIGLPGGGVGYGYGAIGGVGKSLVGLRGMTFPQLTNPVKTTIPVARIGDMLRNPGGPTISTESGGPIPISA